MNKIVLISLLAFSSLFAITKEEIKSQLKLLQEQKIISSQELTQFESEINKASKEDLKQINDMISNMNVNKSLDLNSEDNKIKSFMNFIKNPEDKNNIKKATQEINKIKEKAKKDANFRKGIMKSFNVKSEKELYIKIDQLLKDIKQ